MDAPHCTTATAKAPEVRDFLGAVKLLGADNDKNRGGILLPFHRPPRRAFLLVRCRDAILREQASQHGAGAVPRHVVALRAFRCLVRRTRRQLRERVVWRAHSISPICVRVSHCPQPAIIRRAFPAHFPGLCRQPHELPAPFVQHAGDCPTAVDTCFNLGFVAAEI